MKQVVEIECPQGYKPVYDECTGKIQIVPDDIRDCIKTSDDALKKLKLYKISTSNPSINALHELQAVLDVLNEGHKFDLIKGKIWYPWVTFYVKGKAPKNAKVVGEFQYKGIAFLLVGGDTYCCYGAGLGRFLSGDGVGGCDAAVGSLACKDEETAKYVSSQFGKLVFEACFLRHLDPKDFKWVS